MEGAHDVMKRISILLACVPTKMLVSNRLKLSWLHVIITCRVYDKLTSTISTCEVNNNSGNSSRTCKVMWLERVADMYTVVLFSRTRVEW